MRLHNLFEDGEMVTLRKGDSVVTVPTHRVQHFLDDHYKIVQKDNVITRHRPRVYENIFEDLDPKAELYVDMDGVLADFFGVWTKMMGVDHWKQIKDIEPALQKIRDTKDFWINLPMTSNATNLLNAIKQFKGKYNILSAPLPGDPESEPQKRAWIQKHLSMFPPTKIIIDPNKAAYAKQADGTPNALIDDFGENISKWESAGGIGIQHANSSVANTISNLAQELEDGQEPVEEALKSNTSVQTPKTDPETGKRIRGEHLGDGNTIGFNVFEIPVGERAKLNGTVLYHRTKKLEQVLKTGGLRPKRDRSGENDFALDTMTVGYDWQTPVGIFCTKTADGWLGKDLISFKVEPSDEIVWSYNEEGHLLVTNPVSKDRFILDSSTNKNFKSFKVK